MDGRSSLFRFSLGLLSLFLCLTLQACAAPRADLDADRMGRTVVDAVQRADWAQIDRSITPGFMAASDHADRIEFARTAFPADPPWSIKLLASSMAGDGEKVPAQARLNYLYTFAQSRLVIDLAVDQVGWQKVYDMGPGRPPFRTAVVEAKPSKPAEGARRYTIAKVYKLASIQVTPVRVEDVAASRFPGPPKALTNWTFLGLIFLVPGVMVASAIAVLRARGLGYKPFWALLCFVAVGSVWLDWTQCRFGSGWSIALIGTGWDRGPSPLSPWMFQFSWPLGSALVWLRLALLRLRT